MPTIQQTLQQAVRFQQAGELLQAEELYRRVLLENPDNGDALHLLGVIACQTQRPAEAETLIRRALALQPTIAEFYNSLGVVLRRLDCLDEAIASYQRAIQLKRNYSDAHENLAIALEKQGRPEEAIRSYEKAAQLKPRSSKTHASLAALLKICNRPGEAILHYQAALAINPDLPEANNNLGNLLVDQSQATAALPYFQKAVQLQPDRAEFLTNLGVALENSGRITEAIAAHEKAVQLRPDFADVYCNLGAAFEKIDRLEESIASHQKAIELKPDFAQAHNNLGNALLHRGRVEEGIAACQRAASIQPDFPEAHMNLAVGLLLRGELRRGWEEYEWRWKCKGFAKRLFQFPQPFWDGAEVAGKTILLEAEQGLGDTLHFIRYAPGVAQRGAKLIVACPLELKTIVEKVEGVSQVIWEGTKIPPFDLQMTLLSLPRIFDTTLETIPAKVPYLTPDPQKIAHWQSRIHTALRPANATFNIGLAWAGNAKHTRDRNRSLPLSAFRPLASLKNSIFFSLQKGEATAQIASTPHGLNLVDFSADLNDFNDTAALVSQLDLVLSVDTAVVHLAGALGKPVWTLLPFAPDWRWLLDREDSPWYPTMRLFRQPKPGDWDSVLSRVVGELIQFKR